ncbi:MAG: hypothetical protein J6V39_06865, partial [Clostridia bacterium]|nr:hypothetical protein [Clostridia bacterium]
MKQTAKFGCRVLVALLCLAMLVSVITVPAFAADNSALSTLAGKDLSVFADLISKYNSVKDQPEAAAEEEMLKYINEQYANNADFRESADDIFGDNAVKDMEYAIENVLIGEDNVYEVDEIVTAIENGASFEEIKESIDYQMENPDADKTVTVTWEVDGKVVNTADVKFMKLIPAYEAAAVAGKYVKWNNEQLFAKEDVTITGTTVDVAEKIAAEVNALPMNYGEYEIVYENGVATLYVNVDASNYKQILLDAIGDVRNNDVKSAYKSAVKAFLQASATEIYNGKINNVTVNGYEIVAIEGYGMSQLVDLMQTVEAGNYGEIISAAGLKNAVLVDPITPNDIAYVGDDGILATYDVVLGAEGKADSAYELRVALRGDLELVRKSAQAVLAGVDFIVSTGGDLSVEIYVPGAFAIALEKALNHADISDETKQNIVAALSESATVGELFELFEVLDYDQFVYVTEYLFDNIEATDSTEAAMLEKIEAMRPAFDLFKKFGNILIDKVPEKVNGKEASFTFQSVYNVTQAVTFEDLAALTQLKDADALVGSELLNSAAARVASKLGVSTDRAQSIVMSMVEAFAEFQNRIPDSAKAQAAFELTDRVIDTVFNIIPEKFQDAKLTDSYKGDGKFSFDFDVTYNPGAWLKSILDQVTVTAFGKTVTLGNYVPTRDITSEFYFGIQFADLYQITFVDANGNTVFQGFLPYGAEIAPYGKDAAQNGAELVWVDVYGDVVTTMPGHDVTVYAEYVSYTITFKVLDE